MFVIITETFWIVACFAQKRAITFSQQESCLLWSHHVTHSNRLTPKFARMCLSVWNKRIATGEKRILTTPTQTTLMLQKCTLGMLIHHHHHFYLILDSPPKLLQAGKFNATNVIVGVTRDDGGIFVVSIPGKSPTHLSHDYWSNKSETEINQLLAWTVGGLVIERLTFLWDRLRTLPSRSFHRGSGRFKDGWRYQHLTSKFSVL